MMKFISGEVERRCLSCNSIILTIINVYTSRSSQFILFHHLSCLGRSVDFGKQ